MVATLEALWAAADALGVKQGKDPKYVLDSCGLLLQRPLKRWEYFCTPLNSETFASTGGDGVHYGFLRLQSGTLPAPVVMTVPMGNRHNVIVAESLPEFLSLGYFNGWFSLEQLVYNEEAAERYFTGPDDDSNPERESLLRVLRRALAIKHIPLSCTRIDELHLKYGALVQLPAGA